MLQTGSEDIQGEYVLFITNIAYFTIRKLTDVRHPATSLIFTFCTI